MKKLIKIDCKACNQEKSMLPTKVSKMSSVVVLIGWILVIPSILGILFSVVTLFTSVSVGSEATVLAGSDAEKVGNIIGTGIGVGISLFMAVSSLVAGLIGYLLVMKKKVFKCTLCGSIIDRG